MNTTTRSYRVNLSFILIFNFQSCNHLENSNHVSILSRLYIGNSKFEILIFVAIEKFASLRRIWELILIDRYYWRDRGKNKRNHRRKSIGCNETRSAFARLWTLHVVNSQRSVETFDSFCWFVSVTFRRSSLVPRIICLHLDRHFFSFVPSAWNKTLRHLILLTVTIWYCICKALIIIVERCPVHWTFLLIRVIDLPAYRSFDFAVSFRGRTPNNTRLGIFDSLLYISSLLSTFYPYTFFEQQNLWWIICEIKEKKERFVHFLSKWIDRLRVFPRLRNISRIFFILIELLGYSICVPGCTHT